MVSSLSVGGWNAVGTVGAMNLTSDLHCVSLANDGGRTACQDKGLTAVLTSHGRMGLEVRFGPSEYACEG
jgi:hypothetical protein